ncbi:rod shape-determining protein MreD [Gammaproteobacteria bacterium]
MQQSASSPVTKFNSQAGWVIWSSLTVAFMLTLLPLPVWAAPSHPKWVLLVLIYWAMALPHRVGVGVAWLTGLFLDVFEETLLGQNALSLALAVYIVLKLHQRLRLFPRWQQAVLVLVLTSIHQIIGLWVRAVIGHAPARGDYWLSVLTTTAFWPWVFVVLRDLRRRFLVG